MEQFFQKAFCFAEKCHKGQFRFDGVTPYFTHPYNVTSIMMLNPEYICLSPASMDIALCSAFLHDVIEDCGVKKEELEKLFGKEVADCVDLLSRKEGQTYEDYIEKILESENKIVWLVKWADCTHNLSDLKNVSEEKKQKSILKYTGTISKIESKLLGCVSNSSHLK